MKLENHNLEVGQLQLDLYGRDILVVSPTPTFPLDHGNRKRIYRYCHDLKSKGARIHFVYYPLEWPFTSIPKSWIDEMSQQWDSVHLVPVTRPLYQWAQGEDHLIDEWWDQSLGDMLSFLFSRMCIDLCIVNYPFLSKSFEYCPKNVFKILDMHDKFTNRRKVLEANGIEKEFFYTSEEEEKKALDRADLVWAIKNEEEEFFKGLKTSSKVMTLPYAENLVLIERKVSEPDRDYFVLGIVGAKNNINRVNIQNFISKALPVFTRELAPVKIKLAGGMCDDFEHLNDAVGIEIMGRIDDIDSFYQAVDAVLIPMSFSTGLKIKAIEAFAKGMPVLAHKHAVEGIPVTKSYHECIADEQLVKACLQLSQDKNKLDLMRSASIEITERLLNQYRSMLNLSCLEFDKTVKKFIVTVNEDFFDKQSLYREHVLQHIRFLSAIGKIIIYADKLPRLFPQNYFDLMNGLGAVAKLASLTSRENQEYGLSFWEIGFDELVQKYQPDLIWYFTSEEAQLEVSSEAQKVTRMDSLIFGKCSSKPLSDTKEKLIYGNYSTVLGNGNKLIGFECPYLIKKPHQLNNLKLNKANVVILSTGRTIELAMILFDLFDSLGVNTITVYVDDYDSLNLDEINARYVKDLKSLSCFYKELTLGNGIPGYVVKLDNQTRTNVAYDIYEMCGSLGFSIFDYSNEGLGHFLEDICMALIKKSIFSAKDQECKFGNSAGFNKIFQEISSSIH